jgi:hypothetical protein
MNASRSSIADDSNRVEHLKKIIDPVMPGEKGWAHLSRRNPEVVEDIS